MEEKNENGTGIVQKLLVKLIPQEFKLFQKSQSSVEFRRGPRTTELTVKAYADTVEEAGANALKVYTELLGKIDKNEKDE